MCRLCPLLPQNLGLSPARSSHLWEVKMMDLPHSRVRVTASQSKRRATGSMPVEGSSRKMTGGPPIRAMPALSFRLLPPLQGETERGPT